MMTERSFPFILDTRIWVWVSGCINMLPQSKALPSENLISFASILVTFFGASLGRTDTESPTWTVRIFALSLQSCLVCSGVSPASLATRSIVLSLFDGSALPHAVFAGLGFLLAIIGPISTSSGSALAALTGVFLGRVAQFGAKASPAARTAVPNAFLKEAMVFLHLLLCESLATRPSDNFGF